MEDKQQELEILSRLVKCFCGKPEDLTENLASNLYNLCYIDQQVPTLEMCKEIFNRSKVAQAYLELGWISADEVLEKAIEKVKIYIERCQRH